MTTGITASHSGRIVLTDLLVFALVYITPALSHVLPVPLYMLDPMRLFFLTGMVLAGSRWNSYLLAMSIPLFSSLVTGHPSFWKGTLISFELAVNFYLFVQLMHIRRLPVPVVIAGSIIISKILYYGAKHLYLQTGLIQGELISTPVHLQVLTVLIVTTVISFIFRKKITEQYGQ